MIRIFLILSLIFLDACSTPAIEKAINPAAADSIYFNAMVYTVNPAQVVAEAVAVKEGKVIAVGTNEQVLVLAGKNTHKLDLHGQMLLPGFIDSHSHPVAGGAFALALSLDTYASPEDWVKAVQEYAQTHPALEVIFGYGFLASAFGPAGPDRKLLDAVVSDRPVYIMDEGFHGAWANTAALQRLGINAKTPDPVPGFSYYKRDSQGQPTGYLLEATAGQGMAALDLINRETISKGTAFVIDTLNSFGVTAVFDAGALEVFDYQQAVLNQLENNGKLKLHYVGSYMVAAPENMQVALDQLESLRSNSKTPMSHIRVLKIMDDGTIEGKTAAMFEDYQGDPGNKGQTVFTQRQLSWLVEQAAGKAMDVHIHALGERAIHESLNAIEAAEQTYPDSPSRYTICHLQVIADADLLRFAQLGVIAQSTPLWASYDVEGEPFVSKDQFQRYFRYNSLKQSGAKLSFGSDFPATGAGLLGMSPLFNIQIGHTRQLPGDENARIQPRASERLDIASLIRAYTLDAAYQLRMEDEIGSIEVGKQADFVVLEQNLFKIPDQDISRVRVMMTILGDKIVYLRQ